MAEPAKLGFACRPAAATESRSPKRLNLGPPSDSFRPDLFSLSLFPDSADECRIRGEVLPRTLSAAGWRASAPFRLTSEAAGLKEPSPPARNRARSRERKHGAPGVTFETDPGPRRTPPWKERPSVGWRYGSPTFVV